MAAAYSTWAALLAALCLLALPGVAGEVAHGVLAAGSSGLRVPSYPNCVDAVLAEQLRARDDRAQPTRLHVYMETLCQKLVTYNLPHVPPTAKAAADCRAAASIFKAGRFFNRVEAYRFCDAITTTVLNFKRDAVWKGIAPLSGPATIDPPAATGAAPPAKPAPVEPADSSSDAAAGSGDAGDAGADAAADGSGADGSGADGSAAGAGAGAGAGDSDGTGVAGDDSMSPDERLAQEALPEESGDSSDDSNKGGDDDSDDDGDGDGDGDSDGDSDGDGAGCPHKVGEGSLDRELRCGLLGDGTRLNLEYEHEPEAIAERQAVERERKQEASEEKASNRLEKLKAEEKELKAVLAKNVGSDAWVTDKLTGELQAVGKLIALAQKARIQVAQRRAALADLKQAQMRAASSPDGPGAKAAVTVYQLTVDELGGMLNVTEARFAQQSAQRAGTAGKRSARAVKRARWRLQLVSKRKKLAELELQIASVQQQAYSAPSPAERSKLLGRAMKLSLARQQLLATVRMHEAEAKRVEQLEALLKARPDDEQLAGKLEELEDAMDSREAVHGERCADCSSALISAVGDAVRSGLQGADLSLYVQDFCEAKVTLLLPAGVRDEAGHKALCREVAAGMPGNDTTGTALFHVADAVVHKFCVAAGLCHKPQPPAQAPLTPCEHCASDTLAAMQSAAQGTAQGSGARHGRLRAFCQQRLAKRWLIGKTLIPHTCSASTDALATVNMASQPSAVIASFRFCKRVGECTAAQLDEFVRREPSAMALRLQAKRREEAKRRAAAEEAADNAQSRLAAVRAALAQRQAELAAKLAAIKSDARTADSKQAALAAAQAKADAARHAAQALRAELTAAEGHKVEMERTVATLQEREAGTLARLEAVKAASAEQARRESAAAEEELDETVGKINEQLADLARRAQLQPGNPEIAKARAKLQAAAEAAAKKAENAQKRVSVEATRVSADLKGVRAALLKSKMQLAKLIAQVDALQADTERAERKAHAADAELADAQKAADAAAAELNGAQAAADAARRAELLAMAQEEAAEDAETAALQTLEEMHLQDGTGPPAASGAADDVYGPDTTVGNCVLRLLALTQSLQPLATSPAAVAQFGERCEEAMSAVFDADDLHDGCQLLTASYRSQRQPVLVDAEHMCKRVLASVQPDWDQLPAAVEDEPEDQLQELPEEEAAPAPSSVGARLYAPEPVDNSSTNKDDEKADDLAAKFEAEFRHDWTEDH